MGLHNKPVQKKALLLLSFVIIFTASFDDVLTWEINGATFRIGFVLIAIAGVILLIDVLRGKRLLLPVGMLPLTILVLINLLFAFLNKPLFETLGYAAWFILCALLVVVMMQAFENENDKRNMLRVYLVTNAAMCLVGVVQILAVFFGTNFYQDQFFYLFPRVDAFSAEPSYFANFLIPGFVLNWFLIEKTDKNIFGNKMLWVLFTLQAFGLVFSTSRMGLVMGAIWIIFRFGVCLIRDRRALICVVIMILITSVFMVISTFAVEYFRPLAAAPEMVSSSWSYVDRVTNMGGSSSPRVEGMIKSVEAFWMSPIIGYSLGGVHGVVNGVLGAQQVSNVTAEMLAAFGIFGFAVLIWYVVAVIQRVVIVRKKSLGLPMYNAMIGLVWGLIWQIAILQFNNNILRIYVWVTIGALSVLLGGKQWCPGVKKTDKASTEG